MKHLTARCRPPLPPPNGFGLPAGLLKHARREMHGLLIIAALSIIPHDAGVLRESVDCIERNYVHDADGVMFIDQLVFWRLDPRGWHEVQDWRWAKDYSMSYHPPRLLMTDGNRLRRIDVGSWIEHHSQYDVEMADQALLPTDSRRKLRVK